MQSRLIRAQTAQGCGTTRARPSCYASTVNRADDIPPSNLAAAAGAFILRAVCETLWPTRCAVCDEQGLVLCERCRRTLPYIDFWRTCPRCGAPFGSVLCTECNPVMLGSLGRAELPYLSCASALAYETAAARIVTAYKDRGEQRLAETMAELMAFAVAPEWIAPYGDEPAVATFVPATGAALRRRGFDHAELLAAKTAERLGIPVRPLLARPDSKDQRALGRRERARNMAGRFSSLPNAQPRGGVLLFDDVCTTGTTLAAACDALIALGCAEIRCLTFARVW